MVKHRAGAEAALNALADPTRRQLVTRLGRGDTTVSELAAELPISLPGTLKHLRVLETAGVITMTKHGRTVTCRLVPEGIEAAELWLQEIRSFWQRRLGDLADHFATRTTQTEEQT
jgi:DNA-binding transcriptional ArsR family regulator